MKRGLALIAVGLVLGSGVQTLADVTQNRPDPASAAEMTEVRVDVRTKDRYSPALAAEDLWAACRQTVSSARLASPLRAEGDHRFVLAIQPALGPHARRRLFGCLADATIDNVTARVVAFHDTHLDAEQAPPGPHPEPGSRTNFDRQ